MCRQTEAYKPRLKSNRSKAVDIELLYSAESLLHLGKDLVGGGEGDDGAALVLVVVDDRLGVLVEGRQTLLDGLLVVVHSARGLGTV